MLSNRRQFLTNTAVAATLPRSAVRGANNRIRIGAIGTGGRCQYLLSLLQNIPGNQVVALCDIYGPHRDEARIKYASYAAEYTDFRKLLEDREIDAVVIGAPDHWHSAMTAAAVQAGKDVYVEKPVTHTLEEGEILEQAVAASKRVVQVGMQQRSWPHIVEAKSIVDSALLGRLRLSRRIGIRITCSGAQFRPMWTKASSIGRCSWGLPRPSPSTLINIQIGVITGILEEER